MAKKNKKKTNKILIFVDVLLLVLAIGLGSLFLIAKNKGSLDEKEKEETIVSEDQHTISNKKEEIKEFKEKENDINIDDGTRYGAILADTDLCREEKIYGLDAECADEISLLFAGDVGLAQGYANLGNLLKHDGDASKVFDEKTLSAMRNADLFMINNEFTFTNRGEATENKTYTFRCDPKYVYVLKDIGVDVVSLANNHSYDFGEISLIDTIDTLDEISMPYVGAGINIDEAVKPAYFILNDTRIAIVSATQIERLSTPDTKGATKDSAGTFRCWYDDKILDVIKDAKECSDYVIAYIHWGTELEENPDWAQLELAKKLAEAGVDVIIGDHPHVLQKIDYIDGVPIIYSLGNYWFNSKTLDSCLLEVKISLPDGPVDVRFIPVIQNNCTAKIVDGEERERILEYMRLISPNAFIDGEGYISNNALN